MFYGYQLDRKGVIFPRQHIKMVCMYWIQIRRQLATSEGTTTLQINTADEYTV